MSERFLIKNTTRQQREEIVRQSLSCGGGGCDQCSGCGVYGAGDAFEMYRPYIEGKKELREINEGFRLSRLIR